MANRWVKVVMAHDLPECPDCGEPFCKKHGEHYGDCECIGPTEDDCEYKEVKGVLYARRTTGE